MAKDRNYDSYLSGYEITRAQNQVKDPATIPAINSSKIKNPEYKKILTGVK